MKEQLAIILADLEILVENSEYDFKNEIYTSYEDYITEYNNILDKCKTLGLFEDLENISFVPIKNKSEWGVINSTEIAKHRQLVNKSQKLYHRVRRTVPEEIKDNYIQLVEKLCLRFHNVVRQLRNRYNNRSTLDVNDEYDVQDLLYSLMRIYFDDIRPEEWTPSYAGGCKRMDFLLKNEQTVIEVKKTRRSLRDKELGEQLLIDIETYKEHPDCNTLICFVYDPEAQISNPVGLENDLENQSRDGLEVKVFIYPK